MEISNKQSGSITSQPIIQTGNFDTQTRELENSSRSSNSNIDDDELSNLPKEEIQKKLEDITERLNFQIKQLDTNIKFSYNKDENIMVIQVRDAATGDVIRELPSKEALKISKYFKESIGLLFDKES